MNGYDLTISGLLRKRADIAQDIERQSVQLATLKADLARIEAALSVFGHTDAPPVPKAIRIRFRRGELQRIALEQLREKPQTSRDITLAAMKARGIEETRDAYDRVNKSASAALRALRERGVIRDSAGAGGALLWEMVRSAH